MSYVQQWLAHLSPEMTPVYAWVSEDVGTHIRFLSAVAVVALFVSSSIPSYAFELDAHQALGLAALSDKNESAGLDWVLRGRIELFTAIIPLGEGALANDFHHHHPRPQQPASARGL